MAPTASGLFFPHFVDSGGWTTQFVLFSGPVGGGRFDAPLADDWKLRLEGAYLDFGRTTYSVNHSGNNCGH